MAEISGEQVRKFFESFLPARLRRDTPVVPVVRLTGVIGFSSPLRPGITLAGVSRLLDRAFAMRRAKAVALLINSPGGSPVQSHLIYRRIRQLSEEKKIPVIVFIEDAGASGGYMIACAGDEIYCDPFSIVGSIGVIGATFGLDKAIAKLGIERRVYTAGDRKMTLDPFLPEDPRDVAHIKAIQEDIHEGFIALVKERRGSKLTGPESALFSGEYWSGEQAHQHGLVDGFGEIRSFMRARFGEKVYLPLIADRGWFGRRIPGVGSQLAAGLVAGDGVAADVLSVAEQRAVWARCGL
ncbi:S49 family peptidase [Pseudorhodoplanes sp.]|uniref:S49 family peptidase n=1 Tax=Pseudorhodoplanes sp. TaxID=1934341 RepID=UPI002BDB19B4|nr:S49 family peptidase [Pseudorhodoplanes sp.]HWV52218.1 S49 family peptidase [Pseudorhodoplanes sp.]